jgi:hypothetical protein
VLLIAERDLLTDCSSGNSSSSSKSGSAAESDDDRVHCMCCSKADHILINISDVQTSEMPQSQCTTQLLLLLLFQHLTLAASRTTLHSMHCIHIKPFSRQDGNLPSWRLNDVQHQLVVLLLHQDSGVGELTWHWLRPEGPRRHDGGGVLLQVDVLQERPATAAAARSKRHVSTSAAAARADVHDKP